MRQGTVQLETLIRGFDRVEALRAERTRCKEDFDRLMLTLIRKGVEPGPTDLRLHLGKTLTDRMARLRREAGAAPRRTRLRHPTPGPDVWAHLRHSEQAQQTAAQQLRQARCALADTVRALREQGRTVSAQARALGVPRDHLRHRIDRLKR